MKSRIYVGTSGWHYKYWVGNFYPAGTQSKDFKEYYLQFFRTVEINNSFYKLPTFETFANWRASVPDDFIFAVKANRFQCPQTAGNYRGKKPRRLTRNF